MRRIRAAARTTTLLVHVLLLLAAIASLSDGLSPVPTPTAGSLSSRSSRRTRLNPVAIGWHSALARRRPAAIAAVQPASAFSGGLSLPPPRWHQHFFRRVGLTRLAPPERRKPESSNRGEVKLFGTRLVDGVKSALFERTADVRSSGSIGTAEEAADAKRPLTFLESMACGAVSRSVSQTITHPANAMKTILQSSGDASIATLARRENLHVLTRGAGAQLILSLPQGAVNFAVLEYTKAMLSGLVKRSRFGEELERKNGAVLGAGLDFLSSAASTVCCLVVSGPISVVTDNIMAGNYPNLNAAVSDIARQGGVSAFYSGWRPQLAAKIPSYGVTWVMFQKLKEAHNAVFHRSPSDLENFIIGSVASGATVSIMMPLDTIKVRLLTQATRNPNAIPYKGMADCAVRIAREEGPAALYRGLAPRLASVVPMVAIQFGAYEFMKKKCLERNNSAQTLPITEDRRYDDSYSLGRGLLAPRK